MRLKKLQELQPRQISKKLDVDGSATRRPLGGGRTNLAITCWATG